MQRQFRAEFQTDSPKRLSITQIRQKFELNRSVQNVQKKCSGRMRTSMSPTRYESLMETDRHSSRKFVRQADRERRAKGKYALHL